MTIDYILAAVWSSKEGDRPALIEVDADSDRAIGEVAHVLGVSRSDGQ